MNSTFRRNPGIAEALDACQNLRGKIESLALAAEILRRVREADCAPEMLSFLRRREQTSRLANTADPECRLQEIDKELAAIRAAFALYELSSLDDDEAEILRSAHSSHSTLDVLDAAGLAVRQHAVKERARARDLSSAELAALGDSADPWRIGAE